NRNHCDPAVARRILSPCLRSFFQWAEHWKTDPENPRAEERRQPAQSWGLPDALGIPHRGLRYRFGIGCGNLHPCKRKRPAPGGYRGGDHRRPDQPFGTPRTHPDKGNTYRLRGVLSRGTRFERPGHRNHPADPEKEYRYRKTGTADAVGGKGK